MNRTRTTRLSRFGMIVLLVIVSNAQAAGPAPARARAPIVPFKGLAAYAEYDGLASHADAWKATAAHAIFEKTPAGALAVDIARQVIEHLLKGSPDHDRKESAADLIALRENIARQGFAVGLYQTRACVVVLNGLGRAEARARIERLVRVVAHARLAGAVDLNIPFRERDLRAVTGLKKTPAMGLAWWFEGDQLIVVAGPTAIAVLAGNDAPAPLPILVDAVIDTIVGEASSVAIHPGRAAALAEGTDLKGFESNGLFFVEANPLQKLLTQVSEEVAVANAPLEGLTLPPGKYMHDDVQYFAVGNDFLADAHAGLQRARIRTLGMEPEKPVSPPRTPTGPYRDEVHVLDPAAPPAEVVSVPAPPSAPPIELPPAPPAEIVILPAPALIEFAATPPTDLELRPASVTPAPVKTVPPVTAKPSAADMLKSLGLDGVTRIVGRWGFQGRALLTDVRVEAPAPRRGLVALLDQKGFRKDRLPPIPRAAKAFLVGSLDPVKAYDTALSLWSQNVDESGGDLAHKVDALVFEAIGQRLRDDLLGHLGPTWAIYDDPARKPETKGTRVPILLVGVDDPEAFGKALDAAAKRVNALFQTSQADDLPPLALEALPAPDRGYRLTAPAGTVSWLGKNQHPTILIGKSFVALALNPGQARAAIAAAELRPAEPWEPAGEVTQALEGLPATLTSLTVADPGESTWPMMIMYMPKLVQHIMSGIEVIDQQPPGASIGSTILGLLGIPQPNGFRLRIDPARVPRMKALEAPLFPSVAATSVDDQGVRWIAREAIPFACTGPTLRYSGETDSGGAISVYFRLFLFPTAQIELRKYTKQEGGKFTFGFGGDFAPNVEPDEPE